VRGACEAQFMIVENGFEIGGFPDFARGEGLFADLDLLCLLEETFL